ncbi:hypothetical protein BJX63DRAFT_434144 [Aspergillus granulosus]|uniref:Uncharacterized protein n=1 Tax=Aspergillus granulosus TaxID=176169 RepID=A0ABR4H745_9EURO
MESKYEDSPSQPASEPSAALEDFTIRFRQVEEYIDEKLKGTMGIRISEPQKHTAHIEARVDWHYFDDEMPDDFSEDRAKGFVTASHPAFDMYRRKKFIKRRGRHPLAPDDDEGFVYFDIESDPKYENENPGTVTVEGFGLECWDYEHNFGTPRDEEFLIHRGAMPDVPACKVLRRLYELREGPEQVGWSRDLDEISLKEFIGDTGCNFSAESERGTHWWISYLYSILNRNDIFQNFLERSSVAITWADGPTGGVGWLNFLWQVVIAKELARQLERYPTAGTFGFTTQVLASLIIAQLWVQNTKIELEDLEIDKKELEQVVTPEQKQKAAHFAKTAHESNDIVRAIDLYTEAIELDRLAAVYRHKRAAALYADGDYKDATQDAYIATLLDAQDVDAWLQLGRAQLKLGQGKRAEASYRRATELAGDDATEEMKRGLEEARTMQKAVIDAINEETDTTKRIIMQKEFADQDWETAQKRINVRSLVHERQAEGLLIFAERIKWPYLDEIRERVHSRYTELLSGTNLPLQLYDWVHGISLPGAWFAYKIMSALIRCTPSLTDDPGIAHYFHCGLSLPQVSYWRVRTVLGSVLGCIQGMISLNGWIGPCPPVTFDRPLPQKARHIRLNARRIAPLKPKTQSDSGSRDLQNMESKYEETDPKYGEDIEQYMTVMGDPTQWTLPEPPKQEAAACTIQKINLNQLPLDATLARELYEQEIDELTAEKETEYSASITFDITGLEEPVTYNLSTTPVFITAPPCYDGPHEVHEKVLSRYTAHVQPVRDLHNYYTEEDDKPLQDGLVINATGPGAEVLARAWCAERGKNALIRRAGGPCYKCAVQAVRKAGLGVGVLIWVS